uniref:Uncharacterized protein n=1 Tax=viral metagenome TaxID=1070528 RepID=A0A6C0BKG1_9ZZZZ
MRVLLFSAILYLIGVVVVLYIRPSYMFREDGSWKEFSIDASKDTTPFPFWAFCILWALVSFAITRFFLESPVPLTKIKPTAKSTPAAKVAKETATNLKPGYYVMNRERSEAEGVPRYIYIGPEEPLADK